MDGYTAINFVKRVKLLLSKLALFALHDGICGNFRNNSCIRTALCTKARLVKLHKLKTWTKSVLTCFTKIIAEHPSLNQYAVKVKRHGPSVVMDPRNVVHAL